MSTNYLRNIAIVGATGHQGSHIVNELLKTGRHTITAITREGSDTKPAPGVKVAKVDYNNHDSLVSALTGIDCLIITVAVTAPPDTSEKLVRAAADAKVPWIVPDEWGADTTNEQYGNDIIIGPPKVAIQKLIEELGVSSWTGIACGFWYEYSLALGKDTCGFDIPNKEVTFFDDGDQKINASTHEQVGCATAALLSLPIRPESDSDKSPTLTTHFKNRLAYISSFCISQRDILDSLMRVTTTTSSDWHISHENSSERVGKALQALKNGERSGFMINLYTRSYYPDGAGNFEAKYGLDNEVLGLPSEDLDECTKKAVERSEKFARGEIDMYGKKSS